MKKKKKKMNTYRLKNTDIILNMDKVNLVRLDGKKIVIYFENGDVDKFTFESEKLAEECFCNLSYKLENEKEKGDDVDLNDTRSKENTSDSPRWRDVCTASAEGYYLSNGGVGKTASKIFPNAASGSGKRYFATEKIAKSALAMAQISQIMANDERFGGAVTNLEWNDVTMTKRCIIRCGKTLIAYDSELNYQFLAFHTEEQRDLFIEENEDLVKDYLMLEE